MNELKPTFSRRLQSSTAVHKAPLWLMKATLPGLATVAAKVAFRPCTGFITPRQLGPMMRILPLMISMISRSSAMPGAPVSLKPAEMTMPPGMPSSTLSRSNSRDGAGGSSDDHQVGNLGQLPHAWIGAHAKNVGALGVDWDRWRRQRDCSAGSTERCVPRSRRARWRRPGLRSWG